jgi:hypothetical protein
MGKCDTLVRMKHVIVLGAGASKADGAPLQFDLFRDYFLAENANLGSPRNIELQGFFRAFYGIDVTAVNAKTDFPTFEEVLGTLELALSRNENFRIASEPEPNVWDQQRIQRCREHVVTLICIILATKLGATPESGGKYHRQLAEALQPSESVTFLSFNYDLLIDNAIAFTGRTVDYGTTFANPLSLLGPPIELLKLHGSLNWLRCPICGALTNTGNEKGASYPTELRARCQTSDCNSETTPIVIPPTFFKIMSDFHLQQIWHTAGKRLVAADRIYFCGYSLPDADMHVRYLLKRAEVNRRTAPEVFIASNHAGKTNVDRERERKRYQRQFRDASKVVYTSWSFEDFAQNPLAIATRPRADVEWLRTREKRAAR